MTDYELYGDYNHIADDEDQGPPRNKTLVLIGKIIKWTITAVIAVIVAFLAVRLFMADHDPKSVSKFHMTETIQNLMESTEEYTFYTQEIRVPFEGDVITSDGESYEPSSSQNGFYYAEHLLFSKELGVLEVTIRLNHHAFEDLTTLYGFESTLVFKEDAFEFQLVTSAGDVLEPGDLICESNWIYDYYRLVFYEVSFEDCTWMRLEITPNAVFVNEQPTQAICIYENNESYSKFKKYTLSKKEQEGAY